MTITSDHTKGPGITPAPETPVQGRHPLDVLAKAITELLAPTVVLVLTYTAITVMTAPTIARGVLWGAIAVLLGSILPFVFIVIGVRRGRITDHHIRERRQRHLPLIVALASVFIGLTLLAALDAPRPLLTFFVLVVAVLVPSIAITVWWQISVHTAIAAVAATTLTALWGLPLTLAFLGVIAVGWSRVRLKVHSHAQVWAGATLGAGVGILAWPLLG